MLWTSKCIICSRSNQEIICQNCWAQVILTPEPTCFFCDYPLKSAICFFCKEQVLEFPHLSYGINQGMLKNLLYQLKYHGRRKLGYFIGQQVGIWLMEKQIQIDLIIPVPLHKDRQKERGFNQSKVLAQGISQIVHKPVKNYVRRVKPTLPLFDLNPEERKQQLSDAFIIKNKNLKTKQILIVDDILTTGVTLNTISGLMVPLQPLSIKTLSIARTMSRY